MYLTFTVVTAVGVPFLCLWTMEIGEGIIHFYDASNTHFNSKILLSIHYHVSCHVTVDLLSCIMGSNKLNKTEVAGGK